MRPCSLVVHIASSSLAHVGKQTSCCFICEKKLQTVGAMWPNKQRGLTSSILSNQSTVGGEKAHKQCALTPERGRTPTAGTTQNYSMDAQSHTQLISYLLAETHAPTQTHASITSPPHPQTLSYTSNRYIHSTHYIRLTVRLAHTTLILIGNGDYSDGSSHILPKVIKLYL